jgi:DNA-binding NarL/FixJ family response regulator
VDVVAPRLGRDQVYAAAGQPGDVAALRRRAGTRGLLRTLSQNEKDGLEAILAGVSGFVLRYGPVEDRVVGTGRVATGHGFISAPVAPSLLQPVNVTVGRASPPRDRLAPREDEMPSRLVRELSVPETATDFDLIEIPDSVVWDRIV